MNTDTDNSSDSSADISADSSADTSADSNADINTDNNPDSSTDTDRSPDTSSEADSPNGTAEETEIFDRWTKVQVHFVQDPHAAVAEADALIDEIVQARCRAFDAQRASIDDRWQGADADTEELRLVLQDYRKVLSDLFPRQA